MTIPSLTERFQALQAERERTWAPEPLARNANERRLLVEREDKSAYPAPGARLAPFTLQQADGSALTSAELLADGPAVLIWFRFGGCPACNIALPYYDEALWPALSGSGVSLHFISAQNPVDRGPTERHGLRFATLADPDYALARALGITFFPEDQPPVAPGDAWIGAALGTNSYEITKPAVLIVNPDHTVRWLEVSPDWLARTDAAAVLAALPEVHQSQAA